LQEIPNRLTSLIKDISTATELKMKAQLYITKNDTKNIVNFKRHHKELMRKKTG